MKDDEKNDVYNLYLRELIFDKKMELKEKIKLMDFFRKIIFQIKK